MDEFWDLDCHEGIVDSITAEDISEAAYNVAESISSIQDREKSREIIGWESALKPC